MKTSGAIRTSQSAEFLPAFFAQRERRFLFPLHSALLFGFTALAFLSPIGCKDSAKSNEARKIASSNNGKTFSVESDSYASSLSQPTPGPKAGKTDGKGPSTTSLKIATYNVNYGNANLAVMGETIRKADADIVCLQETSRDSEEFLLRSFSKDYPYIKFQGHQGHYGAERFGILSRLPVAKYDFLPPKHGLFGAFSAEIQWNNQTVQIINVHLQPVLFPANARMLDALKALGTAEKIHRGEMEAILEHSKNDIPAIIAGDFNSGSTFEAPNMLKRAGFVDSFAEANENPDSFSTWHWPTRNGEISLRIDYVFHTRHWKTVESRIIKSEASDHYLIFSRLVWADE